MDSPRPAPQHATVPSIRMPHVVISGGDVFERVRGRNRLATIMTYAVCEIVSGPTAPTGHTVIFSDGTGVKITG